MPHQKGSTTSAATSSRASKRRKLVATESPAEVPKVARAPLLTPSPPMASAIVPSTESNKTANTRTRKTRKLVIDESPAAEEEDESTPTSTPTTRSKPKAKQNKKTVTNAKAKKISKKDAETLKPLNESDKATLLLTRLGLSSMLYHAIEPPRVYSWGKGGFLKLKNQSLHRVLHKKLTVSMDVEAFGLLLTAAKGKVRHVRKEVKHTTKHTHTTADKTLQVVPEIEDELIVTNHPAEQQQQGEITTTTSTAAQKQEEGEAEIEYIDIVLAQSKRAVEAFVGPNGLPLYSVMDTVGPRTVQSQPKLIAVIDFPVVFTYSAAESRMDITLKYRWEESE
eukprot:GILJ01012792.1.p1 GENE.GILJ01012792.1~~GILJ01012792.1.p1  ORF type:complete len:337 (+),score=64.97 GILJ01012792.1:327-1337(+)